MEQQQHTQFYEVLEELLIRKCSFKEAVRVFVVKIRNSLFLKKLVTLSPKRLSILLGSAYKFQGPLLGQTPWNIGFDLKTNSTEDRLKYDQPARLNGTLIGCLPGYRIDCKL